VQFVLAIKQGRNRQADTYAQTTLWQVVAVHKATMRQHYPTSDCEPKTMPCLILGIATAIKWLEDCIPFLIGDAASVVANLNQHAG
jgi:hypothetical protein